MLAAALATTVAIAVPIAISSAEESKTQQAQAAPMSERGGAERGAPGHWIRGDGRGMEGWRGMMHRTMMQRNPQERCEERLAWRAAMRAYTEAKLNLTAEQRPLWDRVQSAAQAEERKERQLCSRFETGRRGDDARPAGSHAAIPVDPARGTAGGQTVCQAVYQTLTPDQRAIFDHPFRR